MNGVTGPQVSLSLGLKSLLFAAVRIRPEERDVWVTGERDEGGWCPWSPRLNQQEALRTGFHSGCDKRRSSVGMDGNQQGNGALQGRERDLSMASAFGQKNHNRPEKGLFGMRDSMAGGITGPA